MAFRKPWTFDLMHHINQKKKRKKIDKCKWKLLLVGVEHQPTSHLQLLLSTSTTHNIQQATAATHHRPKPRSLLSSHRHCSTATPAANQPWKPPKRTPKSAPNQESIRSIRFPNWSVHSVEIDKNHSWGRKSGAYASHIEAYALSSLDLLRFWWSVHFNPRSVRSNPLLNLLCFAPLTMIVAGILFKWWCLKKIVDDKWCSNGLRIMIIRWW